jgi:glycosyltransferase involved in cell wall biosynthesis
MNLDNVEFTVRINTTDYIGRMDFTILTSISEGQPLTILEGYAAHKPAVATDVGNCRGLIYGEDDDFGPAGIVTHIMNTEEIAEAIVELARNPELVKKMGEAGYKRFMSRYTITDMKERYREIYSEFADRLNVNLDSEEAIKRTLEEKTAK